MNIKLNGEDYKCETATTVLSLLEEKGADPKTVVVELNGKIIKPEDFSTSALSEGCVVEVLRFVGGG